jgi:hypothetical protein
MPAHASTVIHNDRLQLGQLGFGRGVVKTLAKQVIT